MNMTALLRGRNRRYSGNDSHFGPFTWSRHNDSSWKPIGIVLNSGDDEGACHLSIHLRSYTLLLELPQLVAKHRIRHYPKSWDTATIARLGRAWYDEIHPREFGFRLSDGFLQVFLGPQTHDSTTTKSWCCHLPWTQWRHVRFSIYDLAGLHYWTEPHGCDWDARADARKRVPKARFRFLDFDGEIIEATTHIQEREWLRGEKWCKWLSWFYPPMVRRSLDIEFSKETGPRKGSWKGGTIGHSIDLLPGELHEPAFRRYCELHNMSFVGAL